MSFPSSTSDSQMENTTIVDPQLLIHEKEMMIPVSQEYQPKLPSSYLSLSIGDSRYSDWLNGQDPLKIDLEHETGDRIRVITHDQPYECYQKPRSIVRRQHRSKRVFNRIVKTTERKKKISKRNINHRKRKNVRRLRSQVFHRMIAIYCFFYRTICQMLRRINENY